MKNVYGDAFAELIDLVRNSRDICVQRVEEFTKAKGALLNLGDARYDCYSTMVGTNEYRAVKVIERLAVSLFQQRKNPHFSFYPIKPCYAKMVPEEQAKTRPFQIVLEEAGQKCGIVFCVAEDEVKYFGEFVNGKYAVDKLRYVKLIDPQEDVYDCIITDVNNYNKKCGINIEKVTIREFWEKSFGCEEYELLASYVNTFNEQAREIIGFSTIVTPTEMALTRFREKTGEMLKTYPYVDSIPDNIYQQQVDTWYRNYIDRGLWRAMIGTSNFATSFITSEWNFNMYMLTENLDLTSIVTGYLKSVEQLIWTIIGFQDKQPFKIKAKGGGLIEFSADDESIIDSTLGSLEQVLKKNPWMFDVNEFAKRYMVDAIDDWREKHRNGYFHKHNLQTKVKVEEIRAQTLQLYFLILGGCKIKDGDFTKLGIK